GAANCGPFHESLNLAAIWKLPVVFLCENNGYALYTPQAQTTAIAHIAHRAQAYEIPGVIVDGQDVLAIHDAVSGAVARARGGQRHTLSETKTYRSCEHNEGGGPANPPPYRTQAEIDAWRARDPIDILVARLRSAGDFTDEQLERIRTEVEAELDAAVDFAER